MKLGFDRMDICFLLGVLLLGVGLWYYGGFRLAAVIVGAIFTILPIYAIVRGSGDGISTRGNRRKG